MNTPNNYKSNLIKSLLNDNSAALRTLDTSSVEFDSAYYRKRDRQIRRYKHDLLIDFSEKILNFTISLLIALVVFIFIIALPIIPIIAVIAIVVCLEEQRYPTSREKHRQFY